MNGKPSAAGLLLAAFVVSAALTAPAAGLINPKFTPADLCQQANAILVATVAAGADGDHWTLAVKEKLKGSSAAKLTLTLDGCKKEDLESVRKLLASCGSEPIILFAGGEAAKASAYVSLAGTWLTAASTDGATWPVRGLALDMSGTYAGGTDMLIPMARSLVADPTASVPVAAGVAWTDGPANLGQIPGTIGGLQAGPLLDDKRVYLFVASTSGDRLFRAKLNDEGFDDLTKTVKLETCSRCALWMDTDGDGRPDLVSANGPTVTIRRQSAGGTLGPAEPALTIDLGTECLALDICAGPGGKGPAILASTGGLPLVLTADAKGRWSAKPLPGGGPVAEAGDVVDRCMVADLDQDGFCDVLQVRTKQGLLWRGTAEGFAPPVASAVVCPAGPACHAVGDFNQDGSLDIFVSGASKSWLWENNGRGVFKDVLDRAGSLGYKPPSGLSAALAADLNQDGRTDLCLLHERNEFLYHFNRGFRCFGEEGAPRLLPPKGDAVVGQKAGALADFNGDGALDLAVAFTDGTVICHYNDAFNKPTLRLRAGRADLGPVTVSVWQGDKVPVCVGAAVVAGAGRPVCIALHDSGPCTLRWSEPGKANCSKTITPDFKESSVAEAVLP